MKKLKHIISWTIWSLLGLYLLLLVLIHIPAFQGYLGRQVAHAVSQKIGTEVRIGRVDIGFFNRLIIDDVMIKDQQGQTMLKANRATVKLDLLPLLDGKVRISSAQLFGAHANLYKATAETQTNFQFALDSLKSKEQDKESSTDLRINSLIIRNSSVSYHQLDAEETPGIFNIKHLDFSDISAYITLKALTKDNLDFNIKRLAFKEQSGLQVDRFSINIIADRKHLRVKDMILQMPHSLITAEPFKARYDLDRLSETFKGRGAIKGASIRPDDFAALLPMLSHFNQPLTLNTRFAIAPNDMAVNELELTADDNQISLKGTASWKDDVLRMDIAHLSLSDTFLLALKEAIPTLPDQFANIGNLWLSGQLVRNALGHVDAQLKLLSAIGNMTASFDCDKELHFNSHVDADKLNLGRLLDNNDLGSISTEIDVNGSRDSINANGTISSFIYKDYDYQNIILNGSYHSGDIAGQLHIDDPNIQTNIEGEILHDRSTSVRLKGYVKNLAPKALNLSGKWNKATFSAVIDADFTAKTLNDAQGRIGLEDFVMMTHDSVGTVYALDRLHIESGYEDRLHYLKMNGDIGEAEIVGQFDWETLPQSFISYVNDRLPTLPAFSKAKHQSSNNFTMNLRLTGTEWVQRIFGIPLDIDQELKLQATVNDEQQEINIIGDLPSFNYKDSHFTDGQLRLTTEEDTTHIYLKTVKHSDNQQMLELSLSAKAGENTIRSSVTFDNHRQDSHNNSMKGVINSITQLYTNEQGAPEAQVRVLPSRLTLNEADWELEPCDILYSDKRLMVDHFNLHHQDQHLIIDGVASQDDADSLVVDLHDIDVAYVLNLVNFHSVQFGGLATGKVYATGLFEDFNAWAELNVEDFTFEHGPMGTLEANAYWNSDEGRIDLHALTDAGPEALTHISGYISPTSKSLDLIMTAEGTPIDFCQSFTQSFLNGLSGHASGEVRLAGLLNRLYLTGDLAVTGQATVSALNATYNLRGDTIHFVPDDILFDGFHVYDRNDHVGTISGGLHHQSFKHITFDLDVTADNLLAYDFPDFDGSTICGTVYTTGTADLHGVPGEVVINCNITANKSSVFTYNASNPDAISNQQFITWREKNNLEETTVLTDNQRTTASIPADIRINFRINATPDATLKVLMDANTGDNISLQGNGTLIASFYNKGPFRMFGTYTTERGTYTMTIQNILKKNFNFQEGGTIIFGGDPFEAALNLNAVYTVNGVSLSDLNIGNSFTNNTVRVNCLMNILGTAGAPRVEFDLEMPTVNAEEQQMIRSIIASEQELNQQVIYLLGIGRFYTQGANNAGTQQYGQTELAMQSFLSGTVSTQINEVLSQVIKNDDWNFGANISTGNEGWHNAEYEGLVSGRMLNNRLLINGQFGYRDNATQANPSFIGDFDIRYLLFPNGNLALKVYNQTNDRYFTRSSLNTQGIGLIMKKDFSGLGDLFHSRKKKAVK